MSDRLEEAIAWLERSLKSKSPSLARTYAEVLLPELLRKCPVSGRGGMTRCTYCNASVDPERSYRLVTGWERKSLLKSRRSGSDIVLRTPADVWACEPCITRLKRGLSAGQGALM